MKIRRAAAPVPAKREPKITVVYVDDPAGMVTLDDPNGGAESARGAFVRLRPTEALSPEETRAWVNVVRPVAKAVRVLPARRSAVLGAAPSRVGESDVVGTIGDEIRALVREADDVDLHDIVEAILSEVDRRG